MDFIMGGKLKDLNPIFGHNKWPTLVQSTPKDAE